MKQLTLILMLLAASSLVVGLAANANAATTSLNVQSNQELVQRIDLAAEDRVKISFIAIGETLDSLRFSIVFPNGTTTDYGETDQLSTSFSANVKGVCELHFDNSNSSGSKLVSLNYEVEHFFFGIPQAVFIIILIVAILVSILAGYLIMGKYS